MQFIRPIDAAGNVTSLREHFYVGFNAVHSFEPDLNLEIRRLFYCLGQGKEDIQVLSICPLCIQLIGLYDE